MSMHKITLAPGKLLLSVHIEKSYLGKAGYPVLYSSAFYSVKLCVMINFSLRHNVLSFSFVVVLYSIYSLYAIIKVVLLNERNSHA